MKIDDHVVVDTSLSKNNVLCHSWKFLEMNVIVDMETFMREKHLLVNSVREKN